MRVFLYLVLFSGLSALLVLWLLDEDSNSICVKSEISHLWKKATLSLDTRVANLKDFKYGFVAGFGKGASLSFFGFIERGKDRIGPHKLALIIDDFGYDSDMAMKFISLPYRVTLSVLPFLRWSGFVSENARKHGKEVLLHLPMQAHKYPVGSGVITIGMSLREVEEIIDKALLSVGHVVGVNNHMGSLATTDRELMRKVMKALAERGLFFIDSYTTPDTVAYHVALEMGLPCFYNSLFIDNYSGENRVEEYLLRLFSMAKRRKLTIGIGHARTETLNALRRLLPIMGKEVELVFASDIVYHRGEVLKDERNSYSRDAVGR